MWKKSGAWFFKCLPQYEMPSSTSSSPIRSSRKEKVSRPVRTTKLGMELDDDSASSEDETDEKLQQNERASPYTSIQREDSFRLRTVGSFRSFFENGERKFSNSFFFNRQPSRSESCSQPDWDTISAISATTNITSGTSIRDRRESNNYARRGSVSSSWSVSESSSGNGSSSNQTNQISQVCRTEPPLGWLEVQMNYCEMNHTLACSVLRARDLPAMDSAGLADPFCKLNIITPEGATKQTRWLKTKTVHKTKNPEFNENITFLGVEPEELGNSVLYVVILDDDKYGHDFLGAAKVGLSTLHNISPHRLTVPLVSEDQFSSEAITAGPWPRGQMLISLCYNTKKRSLAVMVKRCTDLLPMDNNGSSDPFVKLQLKPDSHRKKYKTNVKWRNLNPIFNEEFLFETRPNDLDKQCLIITVWDKDLGKSNDFLGSLILGHNSKGRRLKQWQDCVKLPDHYHEQWHCLSNEQPSH
ncbi:double C2-like domain-containing protein beta isoform X2 [Condylostylus longicornis]|nr:double C2-like domain-containing protein beta isoform X2 [Condylostylus longicornis]